MKRKLIICISLLLQVSLLFNLYSQEFATNSILKSGTWYKIKLGETGVYKLSYEDLVAAGFKSPENVRVYGNGGAQLPLKTEAYFPDDLKEIAIYSSNSSGVLKKGDYYLFYGEGNSVWSYNKTKNLFEYDIHDYSNVNYYYITTSFGPGKRVAEVDNSSLKVSNYVGEYDYRVFHESELRNLMAGSGTDLGTGSRWFGESISSTDFNKEFDLNNLVTSSAVKLEVAGAARSSSNTYASVFVNDSSMAVLNFGGVNTSDAESTFASIDEASISFASVANAIKVNIDYKSSQSVDKAFLDYILINSRSKLSINSNIFFFRDINSIGESTCSQFSLTGASSNTKIWNITDHNNVFGIKADLSGSTLTYKDSTNSLNEYVAIELTGSFPSPVFTDEKINDVGWLDSGGQNLHGITKPPELLIVTHPAFKQQAEQLAELHREKDGMSVFVASTLQVYNEFSSGKPDVSSIRNFARMLYERSTEEHPFKYLLLFGDGSFDNRTQDSNNPNYIPTFQSPNSISPTTSYCTDDIYGMLETGEWDVSGTLDIGVGRIPVKSTNNEQEAQAIVDKIVQYYDAEVMKDWRTQMIFLGDDGEADSGWDSVIFMTDSDRLTEIVKTKAPSMNIKKVYLDAYEQVSSSTGASYPDVEKVLTNAFKKGALVFNYMGHGGESGITQEKVMQGSDFKTLNNAPNFPLFVTATCQLSRYDNVAIEESGKYVSKVSAGEEALLNPNGGAIALLTTTRLVYQSSNYNLSRNVYNYMFSKDEKGKKYRFGDIVRLAKNATTNDFNKLKFTLLGDPAISLAFGEYMVVTDSINGKSVKEGRDTLSAFETVHLAGHVAYDDSTLIEGFDGVVYVLVYDKEYLSSTRGNDGWGTFDFTMQDRLLFRGKASVKNGRFEVEFIIPKDITYSYGEGKISYYAENSIMDAKGYNQSFIIGGTSDNVKTDVDGPEIRLFLNDTNFKEGGITGADPVLLAHVYDDNGINTTGIGIGHDIMGVLDEDYTGYLSLNDFFEGALDDYKRGVVEYPIYDLDEGSHDIMVRVWDTYNNSTEETIGFYVKQGDNIVLDKVYNYPNPMNDYTNFQYSHNMPGEHHVTLRIFDLSGKLIYKFKRTNTEEGFVSEPIVWQRNSQYDSYIQPGFYPYQIEVVVNSSGNPGSTTAIENGKLIILP